MTDQAFFTSSRDIVVNFLQTVLLVDENMYFFEDDVNGALIPPDVRPGTGSGTSDDPSSENSPFEQSSHSLVIKDIIATFAKRHVLCSVIKPEPDDLPHFSDMLIPLIDKSDISILDWKLSAKDGDEVCSVLQELNKKKLPGSHLIIIYSAADPNKILQKICKKLKVEIPTNEDFSLDTKFGRVVIAAKPGNLSVESRVEFDQLSDFAIDTFTDLVMGLISNSVLQAISIIRRNTTQIIDRFSRDLDPPYLTHRMLLPYPEDAEKHIEKMIIGEFDGLIENKIGKYINISEISKWLDYKKIPDFTYNDNKNILTREQLKDMLDIGYKEFKIKTSGGVSKTFHSENISIHLGGYEDSDKAFAYAIEAKSKYNDNTPMLTTGTILASGNGSFFLCVQARCDCVRIVNERAFPFLKLHIVESNTDFNFIIKDEARKYIKIKIDDKPYNIELINFKISDSQNEVIAQQQQDKYIFTDSQGTEYFWLGELRFDYAQKIINEYSSAISRVGVNESEWLRRKYKNKDE